MSHPKTSCCEPPKILQPGMKAPHFEADAVVKGVIKKLSLDHFKGKYLALLFYPADFTFVCPTELVAFSERLDEFSKLNCSVVGVSTDSAFVHMAWLNTPRAKGGLGNINFPLLADRTQAISKAYNVLKADEGVDFRGLFIINGNGILRQITINDLPVGRDVGETLRLIQAFQFTDEHGEVCPANWVPGAKTLKPDAAGVAKYLGELDLKK